jgi:hypothetical protein
MARSAVTTAPAKGDPSEATTVPWMPPLPVETVCPRKPPLAASASKKLQRTPNRNITNAFSV